MTQVATALESVHLTDPLKGSNRLHIKIFNEVINIDELNEILTASEIKSFKWD